MLGLKTQGNETFISLGLLSKLGQVNLGLSLLLGGHCCIRERSKRLELCDVFVEKKKKNARKKGRWGGVVIKMEQVAGENVRPNVCRWMKDFERGTA